MIDIVCVLRSGGVYTPEYVIRLAAAIHDHLKLPHTFTVMTDTLMVFPPLEPSHQSIRMVPLGHDWPGWWSKIELFRFGGPKLYFDLDTIVKDDITDIVQGLMDQPPGFYAIDDWLAPGMLNSSVMYWTGDFTRIYTEFRMHPDLYQAQYVKWPRLGDQAYIADALDNEYAGEVPTSIQDLFPGRFVSFKCSVEAQRQKASVVCFHGSPKPHQRHWSWR